MKILNTVALALATALNASAASGQGFAVVVDSVSQREAATELADYARAIEQRQGLKVYTVVDRWGVPDSIRAALYALYTRADAPIVGCVLVGDIPVAMVRDAQHLCSAFKMSQRMDRRESSVPSDRFYDDFDLRFRFIDRDTAECSHLFYYSLTADGAQRTEPDIFSGRIRPTDAKGESRYEKLRRYLRKATAWKLQPGALRRVLVFNGSGSLSESNVAHLDEWRALAEHFPELSVRPESYSYIQYDEEPYIETKLENELMRPDLDLAVLHHHGDYDTQYLSHYPRPRNTQEAIDFIRYRARDTRRRYLRRGYEADSALATAMRQGVPAEWLADAGAGERERLDSLIGEDFNITLADFGPDKFCPNVKVALFDACYNGSFWRDDYIAGEYIFQPGGCLVGLGGSVNVLQDKWSDRYLGLLADGLTVGDLARLTTYLEWHVIGDPTMTFASPEATKFGCLDAPGNVETPKGRSLAVQQKKQRRKSAVGRNDDTANSRKADVWALELRRSCQQGAVQPPTDGELADMLRDAPYAVVRLEAFECLRRRGGDAWVDAIGVASRDNYELLQRFAVVAMQRSGDPRLVPSLARLVVAGNTSARVAFNAGECLQFFDSTLLRPAIDAALAERLPYVMDAAAVRGRVDRLVNTYCNRWDEYIDELTHDSLDARGVRRQASMMRIYLPPYKVPAVCDYVRAKASASRTAAPGDAVVGTEELVGLLEALGWHGTAYTAASIVELCRELAGDTALDADVRHEALKTLKRVGGDSEAI